MLNQTISERLKKALLQLDLSEKEIASYITLLEGGGCSVQEISRATGINRVTIYAAVEELKRKGLAGEIKKNKKRLFMAESPALLEKIIKNGKDELEKKEELLNNLILPSLKAIDVRQENKPQIKFFEGLNGIYKVYDDYVLNGKDVISCGSYDSAMKISSWEVEEEYLDDLRQKKTIFKAILEDSPTNRKLAEMAKGVMHIKFLPPETKISADILVFQDKVALISYDKKVATLIEDQSIADSIRMYLQFMWDGIKP